MGIVGRCVFQFGYHAIDFFYCGGIGRKIGIISSQEKTALSGFRVDEPGSSIGKQAANLEAVLSGRSSFRDATGVSIRFPADQQHDAGGGNKSNMDQTVLARPPSIPADNGCHLRPDPAGCSWEVFTTIANSFRTEPSHQPRFTSSRIMAKASSGERALRY